MTFALELNRIDKSFPGVAALRDVSLSLRKGSIHALIGENGAGKSTLIRIITGVHQADAGTLIVDGKAVRFGSSRDAIRAGIGVVHQERNLIPMFSIGENIVLDRIAASTFAPISYDDVFTRAEQWLGSLGLKLDPRARVSSLSAAQMQMVEIARALSLQSKVLILDEPTASITRHESETLFRVLRELRDQEVAILFVSHKLEEVEEICDSVTVLRDGRNATQSRPLSEFDTASLIRAMVGREAGLQELRRGKQECGRVMLELRGVSTALGHADINLQVASGEIVGLYGLVGAGRSELARSIIGVDRITAGQVLVQGAPAKIRSASTALRKYGIGYVSEDRKQEGLMLIHSVLQNAGIGVWWKLRGAHGFLSDRKILSFVNPTLRRLEVKAPSHNTAVAKLSGGNQQKVSMAKWLATGVAILIIDEPSIGVDIRTKSYLHQLIADLADEGAAILLISSDLPEMVALADRILIMKDFRLLGEVSSDKRYDQVSSMIMNKIHAAQDFAEA
jgi:ribose transport system ATP-binding protein